MGRVNETGASWSLGEYRGNEGVLGGAKGREGLVDSAEASGIGAAKLPISSLQAASPFL